VNVADSGAAGPRTRVSTLSASRRVSKRSCN